MNSLDRNVVAPLATVEDEHDTVLDKRRKSAPELVVDDEFLERRSTLNLPLIDSTNNKVGGETDDKDHKNDSSSNITTTSSAAIFFRRLNIRDINTATSRRVHVKSHLTLVGLIDIIEVARLSTLLAVHIDLGLVNTRGTALVTLGISHCNTVLRRLVGSFSDGNLLCAGATTVDVLVVITIRKTDANTSIITVTGRSGLTAEVHVVDVVLVSPEPQTVDISLIVVVKR